MNMEQWRFSLNSILKKKNFISSFRSWCKVGYIINSPFIPSTPWPTFYYFLSVFSFFDFLLFFERARACALAEPRFYHRRLFRFFLSGSRFSFSFLFPVCSFPLFSFLLPSFFAFLFFFFLFPSLFAIHSFLFFSFPFSCFFRLRIFLPRSQTFWFSKDIFRH